MQQHYRILGILYLVLSGITLFIGFTISTILHTVGVFSNDAQAEQVLSIIGTIFPILFSIISAPGIIAGIGLLYYKRWALILALILSVFQLLNFPFGTALSIYAIYVFVKDEESRRPVTPVESTNYTN